jgi:glutathione S-transferase
MSLRLHAFPPSPRAFKTLAVANHLGIDYEFKLCDLTKGDQRAAAYVAINPNMKMPTLEDGDMRLWESNAIIVYLAGKKPESGLLGDSDASRADILRWMFWESTTWDPACATLVFERLVKAIFGLGGPDPAEVEKGLTKFNFAAGILEAHLRDRTFVCGDKLTLADFSIGSDMTVAQPAQFPLEPYPAIRRWYAQLEELPAWRATRAMQAPAAAA